MCFWTGDHALALFGEIPYEIEMGTGIKMDMIYFRALNTLNYSLELACPCRAMVDL